jgi:tetratricopeptide (TPR) repeat protein
MSLLIALALVIASPEPASSAQITHGDTVSTIDDNLMREGVSSPNARKINEAAELIKAGRGADAIKILDAVIANEESRHQDPSQIYYSARSLPEGIVYSALASTQGKNSTILDNSWAYGHFLRGFALIDLKRLDEAKAEFDSAIVLAPMNSQFLAERAEWHKSRKDWSSAYADFQSASTAAEFSPEDAKKFEKARALRGMGFVCIEQGELKEAEKLFRQSLKSQPRHEGALSELEYIKSLKSK